MWLVILVLEYSQDGYDLWVTDDDYEYDEAKEFCSRFPGAWLDFPENADQFAFYKEWVHASYFLSACPNPAADIWLMMQSHGLYSGRANLPVISLLPNNVKALSFSRTLVFAENDHALNWFLCDFWKSILYINKNLPSS